MRKMKDSGIEWIGEIPEDWTVCRFKYINLGSNVGQAIDKIFWSDDENDQVFYTAGLNSIHANNVDFPSWKYTTDNDLLLARNGTPYVYLPVDHAEYSDHIIRIHIDTKKYDRRFIKYCLQQSILSVVVDSVSIATWSVSLWNQQSLSMPGLYEQKHIANYLDIKCSEIDSLSANIHSQIETLEQYKKSVITEAVTKGLDKNAEMKDSNMPWIGTIPSHWNVDKIKQHLIRHENRNPGNQQILSVYREYGVIPKDSRDDNHNVTSLDTSNYKYVRPGYLVINKMKAWQGSMGISQYEGVVSPAYFIYIFKDNVLDKRYVHYLLRTCYKDEFRRVSSGIREGQWDLPSYDFENTLIPVPPINEQNKIVEYIEAKSKEVDKILQKKQSQLSTLASYKKSLIYEYVTGKKEVPATEG